MWLVSTSCFTLVHDLGSPSDGFIFLQCCCVNLIDDDGWQVLCFVPLLSTMMSSSAYVLKSSLMMNLVCGNGGACLEVVVVHCLAISCKRSDYILLSPQLIQLALGAPL